MSRQRDSDVRSTSTASRTASSSREWDELAAFSDEDLFDERGSTRIWAPKSVSLDGQGPGFDRIETAPVGVDPADSAPDTGCFAPAPLPGPGAAAWAAAARPTATPAPHAAAVNEAPTPHVLDEGSLAPAVDGHGPRMTGRHAAAAGVEPAGATQRVHTPVVPPPAVPRRAALESAPTPTVPAAPMPVRSRPRAAATPAPVPDAFVTLPGARSKPAPKPVAPVRFRNAVDDLIASYVSDDLYSDDFRREASIKRILSGYVTKDEDR